jgi:exosome complex component CSL4
MLFPGEIIDGSGGAGTYINKGVSRASLAGSILTNENLASIQNKGQIVPTISSIVICRVFKITHNMVQTHILAVDDRTLKSSFLGIIRLPDIRKHEIEKIIVEDCFQPGDIVKAKVISLGDSKWFYLSTSETELGVILAWIGNNRLLPYTWEEMIDPITKNTYKRKVAKPLVIN